MEDIIAKIHWIDKSFDLIDEQIEKDSSTDSIDLGRLEWDIYLQPNKEYKNEVVLSKDYNDDFRLSKWDLLTTNLPKFIWIAKGYHVKDEKKHLLIELIFDSTETSKSYSCLIFNYSKKILEILNVSSQLLAKKCAGDSIGIFLQKIDIFFSNVLRKDDVEKFIEEISDFKQIT